MKIVSILLLFFLTGYAGQAEDPAAPLNPKLYAKLTEGCRQAYENQDIDGLKKWICFDRMPVEDQKLFLHHLEKGLKRTVHQIAVSKIDEDWPMEYEIQGKMYRPNLKPEAQLVITYKEGQGIKETKLLIGTKNGQKRITPAAPAPVIRGN